MIDTAFLANAAAGGDAIAWANLSVAIITGVIGAAVGALGVWAAFRRNPPLPEQMHRDFVSRLDFDHQRSQRDDEVRRLHERINSFEGKMAQIHQDHERALGLIEGRLDGISRKLDDLNDTSIAMLKQALGT
jgi:hypothetical protein